MMDDTESVEIKNKSEAIRKLYPQVTTIHPVTGGVWNCIDKNNELVEIDESSVTAEVNRFESEYAAQEYARNRAAEYPSTGDQLDMMYKDTKNSTTTHADAVETVKTKWPKDNSGPVE